MQFPLKVPVELLPSLGAPAEFGRSRQKRQESAFLGGDGFLKDS